MSPRFLATTREYERVMKLEIQLLLHVLVSTLAFAAVFFFYMRRVYDLLWTENIQFVKNGRSTYVALFLLGRLIQILVDGVAQLILRIIWDIPFYHQIPHPWPTICLIVFFVVLPISIWLWAYRQNWHTSFEIQKSPRN